MYESLTFEISGYCNAKCPWCLNGRGAIKEEQKKYIGAKEFSDILQILILHKIIDKKTTINLYSWGEPLLNPELIEILRIICQEGCKYTLSTNASKYVNIPRELQTNLAGFVISMPGFSQESYSRIHNFSFDKIIGNITKFMKDIDPRKIRISFHIYQFNIDEIDDAVSFFSKYGVDVDPYYAYFNDFSLMQKYLNKNLSSDLLFRASKELILGYIDDIIAKSPPDYQCPQWNMLTIDEWGSILTCCCLPKDHPFYSLNLSLKHMPENFCEGSIREIVRTQPVCKACIHNGQAYWGHNVQRPRFVNVYSKKYFLRKMVGRYTQLIRRSICKQ